MCRWIGEFWEVDPSDPGGLEHSGLCINEPSGVGYDPHDLLRRRKLPQPTWPGSFPTRTVREPESIDLRNIYRAGSPSVTWRILPRPKLRNALRVALITHPDGDDGRRGRLNL